MEKDERGRFIKGNSGGPGRPPKSESLTETLRTVVDKDEIAKKLYELAMEGDIPALKYIYDRIDGRPKETIEQTIKELPSVIEVDLSDTETAEENIETVEE